jgi:hypothetical protein
MDEIGHMGEQPDGKGFFENGTLAVTGIGKT